MQNVISIERLFIYPVKSLRGIELQQSTLLTSGLPYDRYWMIVDENGLFITQRQQARLALIDTAIQNEELILRYQNQSVSLNINKIPEKPAYTATVWADKCEVVEEDEAISQWLSHILNKPVKLVRMLSNFTRPQSKADIYGTETHTYFADAAPYLLCNQNSLAYINTRLKQESSLPVSIENFRPNIVITGADAFSEHRIKTLTHQNYQLACCYPCQRCAIPNINIQTSAKRADRQPYKILSELNPMPGSKKLPAFGENVILKKGHQAIIKTGDTLESTYEQ